MAREGDNLKDTDTSCRVSGLSYILKLTPVSGAQKNQAQAARSIDHPGLVAQVAPLLAPAAHVLG